MSLQSDYYPLPVVKGTTAGTYAEGNHTHTASAITDLSTNGIAAGLYDPLNDQTGVTVSDGSLRIQGALGYADFDTGSLSANRGYTLPNASGTLALTSDIPTTFAASAITSGTFDNGRINFAAPDAIGSTTRNTGAFTTLNANNGTITASAPVLDLAQTWNNSGVTFTGLRFNATDTASAAASNIADFQVGGTSVTAIRKDGSIRFGSGDRTLLSHPNFAVSSTAGGAWLGVNTTVSVNGGFRSVGGTLTLLTAQSTDAVILNRDAADTFAQRNGTNAQTFRLYNTYTDASNYERGFMRWSSNFLQIGTEAGSAGGSNRQIQFWTSGSQRWQIGTGGELSGANGLGIGLSGIGGFNSGASGGFSINGKAYILSPSDGVFTVYNWAQNDFNRLQFGGTTSSFPALKRSSTALQVRLANDSDFAPFECAGLTLNGNLTASTRNIVTDITTGTKIGTDATQKLGFWNATPAVQPAAVADATDAASTQARLNDLLARLRTIGIIAT